MDGKVTIQPRNDKAIMKVFTLSIWRTISGVQ